jgi:hypothetical protein
MRAFFVLAFLLVSSAALADLRSVQTVAGQKAFRHEADPEGAAGRSTYTNGAGHCGEQFSDIPADCMHRLAFGGRFHALARPERNSMNNREGRKQVFNLRDNATAFFLERSQNKEG